MPDLFVNYSRVCPDDLNMRGCDLHPPYAEALRCRYLLKSFRLGVTDSCVCCPFHVGLDNQMGAPYDKDRVWRYSSLSPAKVGKGSLRPTNRLRVDFVRWMTLALEL